MASLLGRTRIILAVGALATSVSRAAEPPPHFEKEARPLLAKYCHSCHGSKKGEAKVNLEQFQSEEAVVKSPKLWRKVWSALRNYDMPPENKAQPSGSERLLLIRWVESALAQPDPSGARDPGPLVVRRLNRTEYTNTVRDLLMQGRPLSPVHSYFNPRQGKIPDGLRLLFFERNTKPYQWDLPPDDVADGFDNNGAALSLPPLLMERYLLVAREVLERATLDTRNSGPKAIADFAPRAFRRPVLPEEVAPYVKLYHRAVGDGNSPIDALKLAFQAMLVSPHFLLRIEGRGDKGGPGVRPVSDHELASRLSYFLWSSTPDDELLRLAAAGTLGRPEVLEAQVRRMLRDSRAKALGDNFFLQWLGIRELHGAMPDPKLFPAFYTIKYFQSVMLQEALMLWEGIFVEDRSVLDLIDPEFAYLNSSLAEFYGIQPKVSGVQGAHAFWHRYELTDKRRGGVLTLASVLTMTSNPTRTNIPRRGAWVLDKILGTPPSPPPPQVPELDEKATQVSGLSLRKQLEAHRRNEACASCHRQMDAIGLAFENYDAIGHWRDSENGQRIDPSAVLGDGTAFSGPVELKRILRERKDDFVRSLAGHMLTYALGRKTDFCDAQALNEITEAVARDNYRLSRLLIEVVKSYPFRNRRNSESHP